ncbi:helix-turn-helix domain-containing protein [Streptomyces cyaneochromogenes]|uniref:Helix-turn-helix domain-containing protein n=1 Tax=Streptomyces cyaneochromogenes TaxID=2496836 RepID=A0A3Q9F047_9ACTN|nr:helix-turn-helix domain-containing protein [Streptomyces cyaneochromogenes]
MRYPDGGGLIAKQRDRREQVRFEAAELFAHGVTPPQVARRLRVSRKSAYAWHARWWDSGGAAAAAAEDVHLVPPRLSAPGPGPGGRLGPYLHGGPGLPQGRSTHPAGLPDAGPPRP